jgi:hypothetical protein
MSLQQEQSDAVASAINWPGHAGACPSHCDDDRAIVIPVDGRYDTGPHCEYKEELFASGRRYIDP